MKSHIVCLSGGLDSATLLAYLARPLIVYANEDARAIKRRLTSLRLPTSTIVKDPTELLAVSFAYGSKHMEYELASAKQVAAYYGIEHQIVDAMSVFSSLKSALLDKPDSPAIPEGHYEEENMKLTVVPGRNMIFASILTGIAKSNGAKAIYLGVHQGDHAIYPDCRPEFIEAMSLAIREATRDIRHRPEGTVRLEAPFLQFTKRQIVGLGLVLRAPLHFTRTCYKAQPIACGKCGACTERLEAFVQNRHADPIAYEQGADEV